MEDIDLDLSPNQLSKLRNGHRVQLRHNQINGGNIKLKLPHGTVKSLKNAANKMKGVRLSLDGDTIELNGGSLKSGWKKFKKGVNKVGKVLKPVHKFAKPLLSKVIRNELPDLLDAAAESYGVDLPPGASNYIVNKVGNETGGYGIHRRSRARARVRGNGFRISNNHGHMLNGMHPAMHPPFVSMPDTSKPDYKNSGGRIGRPTIRRMPKGVVSIQNGGSFLTN